MRYFKIANCPLKFLLKLSLIRSTGPIVWPLFNVAVRSYNGLALITFITKFLKRSCKKLMITYYSYRFRLRPLPPASSFFSPLTTISFTFSGDFSFRLRLPLANVSLLLILRI